MVSNAEGSESLAVTPLKKKKMDALGLTGVTEGILAVIQRALYLHATLTLLGLD